MNTQRLDWVVSGRIWVDSVYICMLLIVWVERGSEREWTYVDGIRLEIWQRGWSGEKILGSDIILYPAILFRNTQESG